jgi:hypothetical protein
MKTSLVEVLLVAIPTWIFAFWVISGGGDGALGGYAILLGTPIFGAVFLFLALLLSFPVFKLCNKN